MASSLLMPHMSSSTEDKEAVARVGWSFFFFFLNGLPRKSLSIGKTQVTTQTKKHRYWRIQLFNSDLQQHGLNLYQSVKLNQNLYIMDKGKLSEGPHPLHDLAKFNQY